MQKRADGRWCLQETVEENGKKVRKTFYGKTQAEARQKRDSYILKQEKIKTTFKDIYENFKALEKFRISPSAYKTKCERIDYFEAIFDCDINEITPKAITFEINKLAGRNPRTHKPTAKRTLARYLQALSNVFEFAEAERLTTYNPCKYVKIPQDALMTQREALTEAEYKTILASDDPKLLAAKIMVLCGLRRGELAELRVSDICDNYISITRAYDYKDFQIKPPKSQAGVRDIPIPGILKTALNELKTSKKPTDYVIDINGNMLNENDWANLREESEKICGFDFSWHQLRHTYATILYDSGTGILEAQKFLGHSDVKVTLGIYTHLSEKKKNLTVQKLDEFLS